MRAKQIQQVLKPLQQSSSQVFLGQGLHTLGLLGWILEQTGAAHIANNEWLVSVITSQNQTYGDRAECTFITTDRDVYLNLNNMLNNLLDDTTTIPLSGRE